MFTILNPDEYDKTAIDYALEAGNYPFLKYLTEKGYIWFVGEDKKEYYAEISDKIWEYAEPRFQEF